MSTKVGLSGYQPTVAIRPTEKKLYEQMWAMEEYRRFSPGEQCAQEFLNQAQPRKGATVLDLGCGSGRGGLYLALIGGLDVTLVDFATNCLDADIQKMLPYQSERLRFVEADLTKPLPVSAAYGFCADVLEHIPTEQVDAVIRNCLHSCQHIFFQIATADDKFGDKVGHKLHLTVRPMSWWAEKLQEHGAVVHWSNEGKWQCCFYVTGWEDVQNLVVAGKLNVTEEEVLNNVRTNLAAGWKQVTPFITNDIEVAILGSGPTLNQFEDEIREKQKQGVKIVTLNAAYNWCMERDIGPVTQIMVDARKFNSRFVKPIKEENLYLLCSQCHPSVFEDLPRDRTYIWHSTAPSSLEVIKDFYKEEPFYPLPGGSTVLLRSILLLRQLGFHKFHLYGCDSCLLGETHHALPQPENDDRIVSPVVVQPSGKVFMCHGWMASQAREFISLIQLFGDQIELQVHGEGLLAYILEHGAQLAEEQDAALAA